MKGGQSPSQSMGPGFCHGAMDFPFSGSEVLEIGLDMMIEGYMTFMWLKHHIIVMSINKQRKHILNNIQKGCLDLAPTNEVKTELQDGVSVNY